MRIDSMKKENVNTDSEKYKEYMYTQHFILIGHLIILFYFQVIETCKLILFLNTLFIKIYAHGILFFQ